ncbi:MAG: isochorismatase family protein [Candidatus Dormibacter sp.]
MSDLAASYTTAGYHHRLGFGKHPALLVIDVVVAYFEPSSPLYAGVEATLDAVVRVQAAARAAALPVVYTQVVFTPGGADGGVFYRKVPALRCMDAGSPLGELAPGLRPEPGDVVLRKQYASAFFGTSLASALTAQGVDSVIVTGLTTSGCVRASAVDAMQHGFIPIVVREAVGDRHPAPHEANLFDLGAKYADVVSETELMEHLTAARP